MKKYILILISFLFIGCGFDKTYHNREEDKQDAEKITEKFYDLIKENNRQEAFKLFGTKFFSKDFGKTNTKEDLNKLIDDINSECGNKISDIQLKNWETFVSVGANPKSQYVLVYRIERNLQNTHEEITLEKENDNIKIMGYNVNFSK